MFETESDGMVWQRHIMECLGDVSWEYKGASGVDTAATIGGGGVLRANSTILIIISNIESCSLTIQGRV